MGGRGWIDTGGIRGEAAAEAAAEAVAAVVGCGRSAKGRRDRLFLLSYIELER